MELGVTGWTACREKCSIALEEFRMLGDSKIRERIRLLAIAGTAALAFTAVAAIVPGGPAARAAVSYAQPGIAVADGNTVIAVQTSGDGLRFYWNQHGTNNWYGEQVAANGTTFSAPAIIPDGNSVVIAARGVNSSLDFYWQVDGTSPWHLEVVAGGDGNLYFYWTTGDSVDSNVWQKETVDTAANL
jgi:hypothetical protein